MSDRATGAEISRSPEDIERRAVIENFRFDGCTMGVARQDDVTELEALINNAFSYQDEVRGRSRIIADELAERIKSDPFFVVKKGGEVVSCVSTWQTAEHNLYFGLLAVAPNMRGTGLAGAVITAVEGGARAQGVN